jgi:hypothetical protein
VRPRGPLGLLAVEISTLFVADAAGGLVRMNERPGQRAPRVFLGRTREGDLLRFRDDLDDADRDRVRAWAASLPPFTGEATPGALDGLRAALRGEGAAGSAGPAFVLPELIAAEGSSSGGQRRPPSPAKSGEGAGAMRAAPRRLDELGTTATLLDPDRAAVLHPDLFGWAPDLRERQPCYGVLVGGQAVAICCCARSGPDAAEAGVETVAGFRGQGFAALATAAWAAVIHAEGRVPFYSTTWENLASRAVARKLGLVCFAEHISVR